MNTSAVIESCAKHGVVMETSDGGVVHTPITLQPLPLSTAALAELDRVMVIWNSVVDRVARNGEWLQATLAGSDPEFTEKLLAIHKRVYVDVPPSKWAQRMMLGVFRSDYLIQDFAPGKAETQLASDPADTVDTGAEFPFKHVEINTISCAFPALSTRAGRVHQEQLQLASNERIVVSESEGAVVDAIATAARWWSSAVGREGVVVFVVQKRERNTGDQKLLAEGLTSKGIRVVRRCLDDLASDLAIGDDTVGTITVDGKRESISVFYLRSLYDLRDFENDACWSAREAMELCNAVKCPSLPYHLCTWKRVQQALSDHATLAQFASADEAHQLSRAMVGQYLLHHDDERTRTAVAEARSHPERYVIKTQKEGTGTLITGDAVREMLSVPKEDPRWDRLVHEHLLMVRIRARRRPGLILRNNVAHECQDLECEVGTFGNLLSDGSGAPILNRAAGYLVRTKSGAQEGGGIMSGVSALDTISLRE